MTAAQGNACYLGSLGQMVALPDTEASLTVTLTRVGGMHRSLRGGVTVDTFARKRTWGWKYSNLVEEQVAFLDAVRYGSVRGPLRLIDPRRLNRLPEDFAAGGSSTATNLAYATDGSSVAYYHPMADVISSSPAATLPPATATLGGGCRCCRGRPSTSGCG